MSLAGDESRGSTDQKAKQYIKEVRPASGRRYEQHQGADSEENQFAIGSDDQPISAAEKVIGAIQGFA